jgi:hypothetical protein
MVGRIEGLERASSVLPEPGGPSSRRYGHNSLSHHLLTARLVLD